MEERESLREQDSEWGPSRTYSVLARYAESMAPVGPQPQITTSVVSHSMSYHLERLEANDNFIPSKKR